MTMTTESCCYRTMKDRGGAELVVSVYTFYYDNQCLVPSVVNLPTVLQDSSFSSKCRDYFDLKGVSVEKHY